MNSLRRIFTCTSTSFNSYFRSRSTVAWLLLFPILLTTISGALVYILDSYSDVTVCVYVQDNCDDDYSHRFIQELNESVSVRMVDPSETIEEYVVEHPDRYVIVIPEAFRDWIVRSISSSECSIDVLYDNRSFQITIKQQDLNGNPEIIIPDNSGMISELESVLEGPAGDPYKNYLSTILVVCVMQTVMSIIIGNEIIMRKSNVSRILHFTKVRNWEWEMSQVLWITVPVILTSVISYAVMCVYDVVSLSAAGIVSLLLFMVSTVPLALLVSRFVSDPQSAAGASSLLIIPMVQLSGGIIPFSMLPGAFHTISRFIPMSYVIEGLRTADTFGDLVSTAIPLLSFAVLFSVVWICLCRYDRRKDLRGNGS